MEDEKTVLVELHDSVAETINRQEELVLSDADEVGVSFLGLHGHAHCLPFCDTGGATRP